MKIFRKKKYQSSGSLSSLALRRFKRNRLAMTAFFVILFAVVIAVLGYLITPDDSPFANRQSLELATKKPGFEVLILKRKMNKPTEAVSVFHKMLYGQPIQFEEIPIAGYKMQEDEIQVELYTGMKPNNGALVSYKLADIPYALNPQYKPVLAGNQVKARLIDDKEIVQDTAALQKEVAENYIYQKRFLLGTDRFGRDLLSQLIIGTRVSLSVGFIAVLISLVIGITLGAIAGYFGGWIDNLIVWFINVVWSIPTLLLVIAITMALGKGYWQVFIAVGLTMWVEVARVVRGQVMSIRQKEFVEAGTALGYSHTRIIFHHILPNVVSPLIVISAANFAAAILIEAGLSFLGIGVQPPVPSWGIMIKEHYGYIILDYAYLAILPGLAIMFMVLAFMVMGNGLRDALDVKLVDD